MEGRYILVSRDVCLCEKCEEYSMALYKDIRTGQYYIECDVCSNWRYVKVEE